MGDATASGDADVRRLAAALGDRANDLAAGGRAAEVRPLWEDAVSGLDDAGARDRITLAYAWYQALHGEVEHGVSLAAGLRESPAAAVRGQVRVLIRNRWRVEPRLVADTWRAAAGSDLPDWVRLEEETVRIVADWVSAADWETTLAFSGQIGALPEEDVHTALDELLLGGGDGLRPAVEIHRTLIALDLPVAHGCLFSPASAAAFALTARMRGDWDLLRRVGTLEVLVHGQHFLGAFHIVAAGSMAAGGAAVDARVAGRLARLAGAAAPEERERAAAELASLTRQAPDFGASLALDTLL